MRDSLIPVLPYFFISLLLSLFFTPLVRFFALRSGFVAYPRFDRWHKKPTALLGGASIFLATLITYFLIGNIDREIIGLIIGSSLLFFVGALDDKFRFTPYTKLFIQIIAACIAVLCGTTIQGLPGGDLFAIPLTLIWIVGVTNSFNLLDNIDGLAAGIAGISALLLFASSLILTINHLGIFALALAGAAIGFLPYNFNPAKIFMGDSGSMFLGFSLAVIAISGTTQHISHFFITLAVPILILAVPIFDTAFVMILRKFQGKPIFEGGKDHTSHHLVILGLSTKKTVLTLYAISITLGTLAILFSKLSLVIIASISILAAAALLVFGLFLSETASHGTENAKKAQANVNRTIINTVFLHKRRLIEMTLDFCFICVAYYMAYVLRFEGGPFNANSQLLKESIAWIVCIKLSIFFIFGLYRGVWRYISISDLLTIFKVVSLSSIASILFLTFSFRFKEYSRAVFFIDWLLLFFLVAGTRVLFRVLGEFLSRVKEKGNNVLIFGAGDTGEMVIREIKRNKSLNYTPAGFLDDDPGKKGAKIQGIKVLGSRRDLGKIVKSYEIKEILIAIPSLEQSAYNEITKICKEQGIAHRKVRGILDKEELPFENH